MELREKVIESWRSSSLGREVVLEDIGKEDVSSRIQEAREVLTNRDYFSDKEGYVTIKFARKGDGLDGNYDQRSRSAARDLIDLEFYRGQGKISRQDLEESRESLRSEHFMKLLDREFYIPLFERFRP